MSKDRKINVTKNYRLFQRSDDNRPTSPEKHRRLEKSMKQYGFLPCFPIICYRNEEKQLIVKDGQHRLGFAESLGLPVYWIEDATDFDVALVNGTGKGWQLIDYARKYAANGKKDYQLGIDFSTDHRLPVGTAFALLAGVTNITAAQDAFFGGTFKVKDRKWADAVAGIYVPMVTMAPMMKNARFIEACMAVCRAQSFDGKRLLQNAERCRDLLVAYSTRDAYLDMLEKVYNFGRAKLVGLKAEATMAMRERNACQPKKTKQNGNHVSAA